MEAASSEAREAMEICGFLYLAVRVAALGLTLLAGTAAGAVVWVGVAAAALEGRG